MAAKPAVPPKPEEKQNSPAKPVGGPEKPLETSRPPERKEGAQNAVPAGSLLKEVERELRSKNRTAADFLKFAKLQSVEESAVCIAFAPEDDIMAQALKKRFLEPLTQAFGAVLNRDAESLSILFVEDNGKKQKVNQSENNSIIEQVENAFGMQVEITD